MNTVQNVHSIPLDIPPPPFDAVVTRSRLQVPEERTHDGRPRFARRFLNGLLLVLTFGCLVWTGIVCIGVGEPELGKGMLAVAAGVMALVPVFG